MSYPSLEQAKQIWQAGIDYRLAQGPFPTHDEYIFHTTGVGEVAAKIAAECQMDTTRAYVSGLLHDYGKKINEREQQTFHGYVGYNEMLKLGYPSIAKICLTHTFPKKDFAYENYNSYPMDILKEVKKLLLTVEYDDYDCLIQLSDMFFEKDQFVNIEDRVAGISARYNLSEEIKESILKNATYLLNYFNIKLGQDVYKIIGLK